MKDTSPPLLSAAIRRAVAWQAAFDAQRAAPSAEPVAWYDPQNTDPGQSVTFSREQRDTWPHLFPAPLYATPQAQPAAEALMDERINRMYDAIEDVLLHHRVSNQVEASDGETPYSLVDVLSYPPRSSTASGAHEIGLICDAIYNDARVRSLIAASSQPASPDAPAGAADASWIRCDERLPEMDVPVWLLLPSTVQPSGIVIQGCRTDSGDGWLWANCYGTAHWTSDGWLCSAADQDDDYKPSHWSPLPNPRLATPLWRAAQKACEDCAPDIAADGRRYRFLRDSLAASAQEQR